MPILPVRRVSSFERMAELQAECMADDIPVAEHMLSWTEEQALYYFESGGQPPKENAYPRVWLTSDVHTDREENNAWVNSIARHEGEAVIVAGDVSHQMEQLEATLRAFSERFAHVFFTAGNHDLWITRLDGEMDSLAKLDAIERMCDRLGNVHTGPRLLRADGSTSGEGDGLWIVPLASWYDDSLDLTLLAPQLTHRAGDMCVARGLLVRLLFLTPAATPPPPSHPTPLLHPLTGHRARDVPPHRYCFPLTSTSSEQAGVRVFLGLGSSAHPLSTPTSLICGCLWASVCVDLRFVAHPPLLRKHAFISSDSSFPPSTFPPLTTGPRITHTYGRNRCEGVFGLKNCLMRTCVHPPRRAFTWSDFALCKWPTNLLRPAETITGHYPSGVATKLAQRNEPAVRAVNAALLSGVGDAVVSFSHFLPREETLPDWCASWSFMRR